ncbi:DUF4178 domain-containing protein [Uliginosibacterium sediminicola]|uniref:DUF4178 domain-containing protein n=1 Tax=Uliginosibacterium sediminicola TaxID=2024550 RepID=A0ABU9YZ04_9RHOO
MFQVACPSCGAQVSFRSAASVLAVCSYCQSTLLRDADSVRDIGKMGSVLEDWSPIQIGTSGVFQGLQFSVVGRLQLIYAEGYWNEWHLLLDDGSSAWLADASGQYSLTTKLDKAEAKLPDFNSITAGDKLLFNGADYIAADIRTARCSGGEGELPFRANTGWEARVADFRSGHLFLTLDYSDAAVPTAYLGKRVTLHTLKCQNLRSTQQISERAGKLPGSVGNLDCPNCGASISYRAGIAQHLVCQSCHAEVSPDRNATTHSDKFEVLAKHDQLEARSTTLALGDTAQIDKQPWTLIGLLERKEIGNPDESSSWVEYLLYNPDAGLRWIVESMEGWDLVEVLDDWPSPNGANTLKHRGLSFNKRYDYTAEVIWAAGAFNWRVKVGDRVTVRDYKNGQRILSAERNREELTWSLAKRVPTQSVMRWFGKAAQPEIASASAAQDNEDSGPFCRNAAIAFSALILILNAKVMLNTEDGLMWPFIGLFALWYPVLKGKELFSGDED